jgi:metallophosphoesterase (TIGR03767 family)
LTRRISPVALCAVIAVLVSSAVALADPAGKTTLKETVRFSAGSPLGEMVKGPGESTVVRKTLAKPTKRRAKRRQTIGFFGTMTDPQIMDKASPARSELIDPSSSPFESAWRPHEFGALQNFDQLVRNMNANRTSPFRQGNGKRSKMKFILNTGDMADSAQYNEVLWYIRILEGGTVDPFTGKPIGPNNKCDQANQGQKNQLDAAVAAREYTGVQDYGDWRGEPADRYDDFWDPDEAPPSASSPYANWPRYPGLMDRVVGKPFAAQGLNTPWYTARGNHDALWQGTFRAPASLNFLTTACIKPFPNDKFDGHGYGGENAPKIVTDLQNPDFITTQINEAKFVPPDPDRRFLYAGEYQKLHAGADNSHGFGFVSKTEKSKSKGAAAYYSFVRNGIRFIAIDTNAEGGDASGNVDDPQYKWIERELKAAKSKKQLVVTYSHHPLRSQTATITDEDAPACSAPTDSQCDLDPRKSTPIHRGLKGPKSMKDLLLKYPNVIAYVVGHIHENEITARKGKGGSGFWEIATASEIDWPQQGRLLEVMNNRDGTLSIFATMVDTAAPIASPAPGSPASVFTEAQIGSLMRKIAANDPQTGFNGSASSHAEGKRVDRNVEMVVNDPR